MKLSKKNLEFAERFDVIRISLKYRLLTFADEREILERRWGFRDDSRVSARPTSIAFRVNFRKRGCLNFSDQLGRGLCKFLVKLLAVAIAEYQR